MTYFLIGLALLASVGSLSLTIAMHRRQDQTALALAQAVKEKAEVESTLVELMDADGAVRGRLALPGKVHDPLGSQDFREARKELAMARTRLESVQKEADAVKRTLVEAVDEQGNLLVTLRLPGDGKAKRAPVTTPCGPVCIYGHWNNNNPRGWHCMGWQGATCDAARPHFEDDEGQCVMYRENKDYRK